MSTIVDSTGKEVTSVPSLRRLKASDYPVTPGLAKHIALVNLWFEQYDVDEELFITIRDSLTSLVPHAIFLMILESYYRRKHDDILSQLIAYRYIAPSS